VSGKDNLAYAATCSRRASLYQSIGQYEQAELLHLKAKQIRERLQGRNDPDYAACCDNLALLYMAKGQYWKAEPLFIEAKQIREKKLGKNNYDYAASCDNLALLYMDWEKYDKSEALFVESKQINEALGKSHPNYASSCNNLARLYQCTGKYPQAEQLYKEAKQIWEKAFGQYHPKYAIACGNLANLYRLMGQPFLAQKEFEAAFAAKSYNLTHVFQFTNEKEKAAYIKNISGGDESAFSFYLSERIKSGHPYSLSLFHRNLILSASQALRAQLLSSEDTNIINKYNEWVRLKKILAVQYSRPVAERDGDLAETEGRAGRLEKALTRLSSSFAKQQRHVDWTDIRARLKSDEAAIEFVSFRLKNGKFRTDTVLYLALILRKDSLLPAMVSLFNEKELQHLLPDAGNKPTKEGAIELYTLGGPDSEVDNKPVYELTWKPLEKELIGINTIYFAPSGLLHRIAFAALPVNSTQVLSDKYKLIQLATTASVADQQPSFITASDKIQLYGDISYNADTSELKNEAVAYNYAKSNDRSFPADSERRGSWPQLPGTKKELEAIVSRSGEYKSKITSLSGINATEESLKALDGKASPGLIHIATHGFFFTNQEKDSKQQEGTIESGHVFKSSNDPLMRSGLLFAGANHAWQNKPIKGIDDGILTAYEVANFYLPNTKLVVLSACETALGDIQGNEGVYGLQRAFKIAGVQNLVMSLWKVPDGKTPEFMQEFYKNMFAKQAISDAFYNAQKVMKDKYRSQPVNWAAWVLVR
jgi:CHAT domain-containing protein/tetratricopeptide (TPR) repeat protein